MRVIKTVMDIKGLKKFKKNTSNNQSAVAEIETLSPYVFNVDAAKETFRKNTQRTSYRT